MILRAVVALGLVWLCMGHNMDQNSKTETAARQAVMARLHDMRQDIAQDRAAHPVNVAEVSKDAAIQVAGFTADHLASAMRDAVITRANAAEKN